MITVYEIATRIRQPYASGKANRHSPPITEGLQMATGRRSMREGIHMLSPSDTLALWVPVLTTTDGEVNGYQRDASKTQAHVREIAQAIEAGRVMPTATVGVGEDRMPVLTDGGHRALAHVMTRTPFRVEIRALTSAEQRELFHGQALAKKLKRDHSVLTGDSRLALYVQEVFTSPEPTPWDGLIALNGHGRMISPAGLEGLAAIYGTGVFLKSSDAMRVDAEFDANAANELAVLLRAFGTPKTNPLAFSHMARRAITMVAAEVFIRREQHPDDRSRWMRHMPAFDFAGYQHLRTTSMLRPELIRHWNKRLPMERKLEVG